MKVEYLLEIIGADFYTGVPDSQLSPLCNYLMKMYGVDEKKHVIAANEGNAVALATGYHLATGKIPVVYLQNSGEGNIINPVASLLNEKVYAIPIVFIVGWRGEPGVYDEPQHVYQGEITIKLLEDMGINSYVIRKESTESDVLAIWKLFKKELSEGKSVAFVIAKDALSCDIVMEYGNNNLLSREEVIRQIVDVSGEDLIVSTTGKASRELFEIREDSRTSHKYDFLTVGSMGHSSSIALGIALNKPAKRVWCIDGDGALLMHMGALAVIGTIKPRNFVHVIINNSAHESVGGMPTVAGKIDIVAIAKACGYSNAYSIESVEQLKEKMLEVANSNDLAMIEVKCSIGSRKNLGRPTVSSLENKRQFTNYVRND